MADRTCDNACDLPRTPIEQVELSSRRKSKGLVDEMACRDNIDVIVMLTRSSVEERDSMPEFEDELTVLILVSVRSSERESWKYVDIELQCIPVLCVMVLVLFPASLSGPVLS